MSKQHRFPNPFRFIYKHSGILAPARELIEDPEDAGDYVLAGLYVVVAFACIGVVSMLIPLKVMGVTIVTLIILIAFQFATGRRR
jgi:hypothetical protein